MKGEIFVKKKLFVKQRDFRDCGPCCLLSIIKFYEGNINLEQIRLEQTIMGQVHLILFKQPKSMA